MRPVLRDQARIEKELAERTARDLLLRVVIGPETRVLLRDHQDASARPRQGDQLARLFGMRHEGLLGQDVLIGAEGVADLPVVQAVRRHDDHAIDVRRQEFAIIAELVRRRRCRIALLQRRDIRHVQIGERDDPYPGKIDQIVRVSIADPPQPIIPSRTVVVAVVIFILLSAPK